MMPMLESAHFYSIIIVCRRYVETMVRSFYSTAHKDKDKDNLIGSGTL